MTETKGTLTITFKHPIKVFALVLGGWYPLAFAPSCIFLLDRNILGILHQLADTLEGDDLEADKQWLEFINSAQYTLNPILCALESDKRAVPSKAEFTVLFEQACDKIHEYLPRAKIIASSNAYFDAVYEVISRLSERYELESEFLISAAPIISQRKKDSDLQQAQTEILALCEHYRLNRTSLAVIAVLSCLYEPKDGSQPMIGRNVLKPGGTYRKSDAHNAISDLRALEVLAATNGLNLNCASLCTRDKYLAALWCGLHFSELAWKGGSFSCRITPDNTLFPRLSESEMRTLMEKLNFE
jgi:hypothetical protein